MIYIIAFITLAFILHTFLTQRRICKLEQHIAMLNYEVDNIKCNRLTLIKAKLNAKINAINEMLDIHTSSIDLRFDKTKEAIKKLDIENLYVTNEKFNKVMKAMLDSNNSNMTICFEKINGFIRESKIFVNLKMLDTALIILETKINSINTNLMTLISKKLSITSEQLISLIVKISSCQRYPITRYTCFSTDCNYVIYNNHRLLKVPTNQYDKINSNSLDSSLITDWDVTDINEFLDIKQE
jgi:hypothetical protein